MCGWFDVSGHVVQFSLGDDGTLISYSLETCERLRKTGIWQMLSCEKWPVNKGKKEIMEFTLHLFMLLFYGLCYRSICGCMIVHYLTATVDWRVNKVTSQFLSVLI